MSQLVASTPLEGTLIDAALAEQNALLSAAGIGLRFEKRGERLGLRGPLPCRQGRAAHPVQRISLGLPATTDGLEQAKAQLKNVLRQLQQQRFDWSFWARQGKPESKQMLATTGPHCQERAGFDLVIQDFEEAFFKDPRRRRNPSGAKTTWTSAYRPYLRRMAALAGDSGLAPDRRLFE